MTVLGPGQLEQEGVIMLSALGGTMMNNGNVRTRDGCSAGKQCL